MNKQQVDEIIAKEFPKLGKRFTVIPDLTNVEIVVRDSQGTVEDIKLEGFDYAADYATLRKRLGSV